VTGRNEHRILLVEPPFYRLMKDTYSLNRLPLSLGYLEGTVRERTNWNVLVYNADFAAQNEAREVAYMTSEGYDSYINNLQDLSMPIWREIKSAISEYKPTVVGISAKSQNFASARIVAKLIKEIDGQCIVIAGGPQPSMVGAEVLDCPYIDVCVQGEGENTIVELLDAVEHKKEFDGIQGIIYRKDSSIVKNSPREYIEDMDSLCFPHEIPPENLKDYDQYPITAFKNIFAIRGCPYNCFFCGSRKIWSRRPRFRSPENVIREIKGLQNKGLKSVHFDDDTFGINKKYIHELCGAIATHCPGLKWSCELHVKLVDEQTISVMKAAGCYFIQIGIESGNNEILKKMRKHITIEEAITACRIVKKQGLNLQLFFMVGYPHETEETLMDTVRVMKKIKCDVLIYSIFIPYPGTEAFEFCKEKGLIDDNYNVSLHNHQSRTSCFCMNITLERFRVLVSRIEKMVDRKNAMNRIKRVFSLNTIWRVQELGVGASLEKGVKIFFGK